MKVSLNPQSTPEGEAPCKINSHHVCNPLRKLHESSIKALHNPYSNNYSDIKDPHQSNNQIEELTIYIPPSA